MKTNTQTFAIQIPDANGERAERAVSIDVPVRWDEMIDEWVLTEEAHEMIDNRKALEMGLLSPEQLRALRERLCLNQKQMGQLFQVGEKSWNRWESGKHRPTRSINLLIRALHDGEISLRYLRERAGMPVEESHAAGLEMWRHVMLAAQGRTQAVSLVMGTARTMGGKLATRDRRPKIRRSFCSIGGAARNEYDPHLANAS